MIKIFKYFLIFIPYFADATVYIYNPNGPNGNNCVIDNTTFGTPLVAGDIVQIDVNPNFNGWRCFKVNSLTGSANNPIIIRFINGAFIWPNTGSQIQESQIQSCYGVRIVNLIYRDNSDVSFRVNGTTQSQYITIDSAQFRNWPTLFQENSGSMTAFSGSQTNMFAHWKILHSSFDSTQNGNFGDMINIGAISTKNFWYDVEIAYCTFNRIFSNGGPGHAINMLNVLAYNIHDNTISNLGVIANPNGHAAAINIQGGFGDIYNNHFGPQIFGNDVRVLGIYDLGAYGISGYVRIWNNIMEHKRKYPGFEPRDFAADITTLSPYALKRSRADMDNCSMYSMGIGSGLTPPSAYVVSIYDWYGIDSVYMHDNLIAVVNDTTWASANVRTLSLGVGGSPIKTDSSNNVIAQFFNTSGLNDTTWYYPKIGARLDGQGATLLYFNKDLNGNNRPIPWSVGALILGSIGPISSGSKLVAQ